MMMVLLWRRRCSLLVVLTVAVTGKYSTLAFSAPTSTTTRSTIRMDTEGAENHRYILTTNIRSSTNHKVLTIPSQSACPIEQAQSRVGMPWQTSIDPTHDEELLYMPFWEWQLEYMKENLQNLRPTPVTNLDGTIDFSLHTNVKEKARIVNLCFESDEYRKIRMTYYDAGHKTQVFNSLWYPRANLPVLGIDLLQFYGKKHLAVVDFQPLYHKEEHHDLTFSHLLQPIQAQYPSLQGKMSNRFYDETQFFSQHMLFSRFEDTSVVEKELYPAFQDYVKTHVDLSKSTCSSGGRETPWKRHAAYDAYSAKRDPATAMFEKMFGKQWADDFVEEFLFSLSRYHKEEEET